MLFFDHLRGVRRGRGLAVRLQQGDLAGDRQREPRCTRNASTPLGGAVPEAGAASERRPLGVAATVTVVYSGTQMTSAPLALNALLEHVIELERIGPSRSRCGPAQWRPGSTPAQRHVHHVHSNSKLAGLHPGATVTRSPIAKPAALASATGQGLLPAEDASGSCSDCQLRRIGFGSTLPAPAPCLPVPRL